MDSSSIYCVLTTSKEAHCASAEWALNVFLEISIKILLKLHHHHVQWKSGDAENYYTDSQYKNFQRARYNIICCNASARDVGVELGTKLHRFPPKKPIICLSDHFSFSSSSSSSSLLNCCFLDI